MPQARWKALLITTTSSLDSASVGSLNRRREEPKIRVPMSTDLVGELADEPIGDDSRVGNPKRSAQILSAPRVSRGAGMNVVCSSACSVGRATFLARPHPEQEGYNLGARLFVDNLPPGTTEEALHALFSQDGRTVLGVGIRADHQSGDSLGYAFVEMASQTDARHAIVALHGHDLHGQRLHVSEARPRDDAPKVSS
jgi:hypothetical protein